MSRPSSDDPGPRRQRRRTLAAYDEALLEACAALGVTGRSADAPRAPLTAQERTALSKALAGAGLDVRVPPPVPTAD